MVLSGFGREVLASDSLALKSVTTCALSAVAMETESEYQIQAAFIYNFMKFTEWSKEKVSPAEDSSGSEPKKPMMIGIIGDSPFGKSFEPIQEKTIREHPLRIVSIPSLHEHLKKNSYSREAAEQFKEKYLTILRSCHVLYICESEQPVLKQLLALVDKGGVMSVSNIPSFIDEGGVIGFKKEENKIRFETNLKAAEPQNLKISSQLLKLAARVKKEETKKQD